MLRSYDALGHKGGRTKTDEASRSVYELKARLSWSTVSLQTEPLALTQWGDVEMVFLENSFHNNRKQSSLNSQGIKRFFLLFLQVSRFQWLRNGIRYQATRNVFWSQIWPRVAVSGKGWGGWVRMMERTERQQANADRDPNRRWEQQADKGVWEYTNSALPVSQHPWRQGERQGHHHD